MSFKFRYKRLGAHTHVNVWASEFGPQSTHGHNGELIFRNAEWDQFRRSLELGRDRIGWDAPSIVFIEEQIT
jgi:hypothetical protein